MKVLVTGGAGYIGAHVCDALVAAGYQVRIFDDFSNGLERRTKNFTDIVKGDITDRQALLNATSGVDAVIHLAAKKAVGESVMSPLTISVKFLVRLSKPLEKSSKMRTW